MYTNRDLELKGVDKFIYLLLVLPEYLSHELSISRICPQRTTPSLLGKRDKEFPGVPERRRLNYRHSLGSLSSLSYRLLCYLVLNKMTRVLQQPRPSDSQVSHLPKVLFGWLNGHQDLKGHQIKGEGPFSGIVPSDHQLMTSGDSDGLLPEIGASTKPLWFEDKPEGWESLRRIFYVQDCVAGLPKIRECLFRALGRFQKMKTPKTEPQIGIPNPDLSPTRRWIRKATSRSTRADARDQKVEWFRKRCYHCHPYFTDNLRYVY